ncbi:hypothetical protein TVAG_202580 [Trichomonas vaginalis G3]|uniref:LisH domain-containing protein n=1 Tax=Trichomonas vaginalis (strain ATCC PRA-98 / G3) TaxID=412133 RepID=A2END1_TRIV3|nr:hypothetical protein TVAGG3_0490540 [Trichomonas vaginalis G3]EAY05801.1 hypothetical protein TVAG_202580 [Trichomonas vaginalis G3]KAI5516340.1 hypothetical protein TVAGG3_0490540 [Trichomonas vaginalis G3]|eukprot:XP_001318024.1 hypothetical protein [Trichomonas vaginalis G3]
MAEVDKEAALKQAINDELEKHGFLAMIRNLLRIESVKQARKLAFDKKIENTKEIQPIKLEKEEDAVLLAIVYDFLKYCKLDLTKEMLDLELDPSTEISDIEEALPQVADGEGPYLLRLIKKIREERGM